MSDLTQDKDSRLVYKKEPYPILLGYPRTRDWLVQRPKIKLNMTGLSRKI